jgi:acetyl esterase/lipase
MHGAAGLEAGRHGEEPTMKRCAGLVVAFALTLAAVPNARAQSPSSAWAATVANEYRVVPGIVYLTASNWDATLDVYTPRSEGPHPTVLHIHGGGWVGGSRESVVLRALPFLEMGLAVVNVSYRLSRVAEAPAAVEDCLCALRWIVRNAKEYGFDVSRIVVTGDSAGGHLALTTGMLPAAAGLDRQCPGSEPLDVAAIVNWYGITDVADLLDGANTRSYAVQWLGSRPDRTEIARRVSPLTYVRAGLPPILTIHGDADPTVPYAQATRLHAALQQAGGTSELVTVPKGGHGNFPRADQLRALDAVRAFLARHGIVRTPAVTSAGGAAARR